MYGYVQYLIVFNRLRLKVVYKQNYLCYAFTSFDTCFFLVQIHTMSKYISKYILESEFICPHCDSYPPAYKKDDVPIVFQILFDTFNSIREEWGRAIPITSFYRCPVHNSWQGGVPLSIHQWGLAIDMNCKDSFEVDKLSNLIDEMHPEVRMGTYKKNASFIHMDIGYFISPKASDAWVEGMRWYA